MKNKLENMEEILSSSVSGFHQYCLTEPLHISYVSDNLCEMLGVIKRELLSESTDLYERFVHPADLNIYSEFLSNLKSKEQTLTVQYRLLKKNGTVLYVSDTVTSKKLNDGTFVGYSVLTDITDIKNENYNLQFLNETIPCGFLKYTCDKQPKITYINDKMQEFLRFPKVADGEMDYLEMYKENIYLMVPMEDRRKFALYLKRVYTRGAPIAGEMTLLRCDGTKVHLFGWVTKCINEQGVEEFQSVCMDVTERYQQKKEKETKQYIKALTDVYDKIFEYDLSNSTVKCLYGRNSEVFKWIENIPMQMEEATEKWITSAACKEDRDRVRAFFKDFFEKKFTKSDPKPPQIQYSAVSDDGKVQTYTGIFLKIDSSISLFCCRNMPDAEEVDSSRKSIQEIVMRFTDGIAAFEVAGDYVTPLYASDNVCEFFGFTKEEWIPMMKKSTLIKTFVSGSKLSYEDIAELLQHGEAEFTYFDLATGAERRIKAICSHKSADNSSPRYIMLYNVDDGIAHHADEQCAAKAVSIRTFGYFDVFVGGKPIAFRSQKSKELFALLVDRRGGFVSSDEAISFLWEEEPISSVTLARYRKVALRLKNILEEYGISDIIESVDGKRRIVADKVQCDLYDYLSGGEEYAGLFKGSYLTNYSWGENTLAELTGDIFNQELMV